MYNTSNSQLVLLCVILHFFLMELGIASSGDGRNGFYLYSCGEKMTTRNNFNNFYCVAIKTSSR